MGPEHTRGQSHLCWRLFPECPKGTSWGSTLWVSWTIIKGWRKSPRGSTFLHPIKLQVINHSLGVLSWKWLIWKSPSPKHKTSEGKQRTFELPRAGSGFLGCSRSQVCPLGLVLDSPKVRATLATKNITIKDVLLSSEVLSWQHGSRLSSHTSLLCLIPEQKRIVPKGEWVIKVRS